MARKNITQGVNFKTSFLSCEKDQETIWRKLFIDSAPYSNVLKRLLIINTKDCLDPTQKQYEDLVDSYDVKKLKDNDYIGIVPKLPLGEHEEVKTYLFLEFDDFFPNATNPYYRDCTITLSIICNLEEWELDDYKIRPWQIAGYIDGILNESKLSGIGTLEFIGASQVILSEELGGVVMRYQATHGQGDDTGFVSDILDISDELADL